MNNFNKIAIILALLMSGIAMSAGLHEGMEHSKTHSGKPVLTEAGTDAFATLQEAIRALEADPKTNWNKVNLEALRLHLLEMNDMVLNVKVRQNHISKGFAAIVTPTTDRALQSLKKVFSAHPAQMKKESGWDMKVSNNSGVFTLKITTENASEVAKIRALGYIGVMAAGGHHQPHHWAISSGRNPH